MKPLLTLIFLSLFLFAKSQNEINLDNNITGIYSQSSKSNLGLNFNGNNGFYHNHLSLDFNTNYLLKISDQIQENELLQRSTIDYDKGKWDAFITHQYNYSLIRKINSDNWIGTGFGLKKKFEKSKISFSYAFMFQKSVYRDLPTDEIWRHSLRLKYRIENKYLGFTTEIYYQPNISDFSDYIVLGTSRIIILPENKINFLIQDVINFRSQSEITTLHNLTIGLGVKFNKIFEKEK